MSVHDAGELDVTAPAPSRRSFLFKGAAAARLSGSASAGLGMMAVALLERSIDRVETLRRPC